jgi:hypothetical protein
MTDHQHTAETLNRAADLIEQRGWKSGGGWQYADQIYDDMPLCLEGGIQAATGHRFTSIHCTPGTDEIESLQACPAYRAVQTYLEVHYEHIYNWNDTKGRTASEVIEVLRAAAVIEQAKHDVDQPEVVIPLIGGSTLYHLADGSYEIETPGIGRHQLVSSDEAAVR